MRRLTRRQKRKLKRIIGETVSAAAIGVALGGLLIFGFATDSYTPPEPPEHFGQVEYGGIWWEQEDYEAMMAEREEYLAAEQKEIHKAGTKAVRRITAAGNPRIPECRASVFDRQHGLGCGRILYVSQNRHG